MHGSLDHTIFPALDLLLGNFHRIVTQHVCIKYYNNTGHARRHAFLKLPQMTYNKRRKILSATTWICKTMLITITTNWNKKKSLFCYSQWKNQQQFFICYTSCLDDRFMILLVVTCNLKAFHSSCDTKTFGAIQLRGLLCNENND